VLRSNNAAAVVLFIRRLEGDRQVRIGTTGPVQYCTYRDYSQPATTTTSSGVLKPKGTYSEFRESEHQRPVLVKNVLEPREEAYIIV
jgi:hypothetical protein